MFLAIRRHVRVGVHSVGASPVVAHLVIFVFTAAGPTCGRCPAADSPVSESVTSVLVMNNGRVLSGRVSQSAGGYLVRTTAGSVLVPFERVHLHATDLRDAYRRLRSSMPNPSASTHIALARWCLTQQLYRETQAELRSALEIEPDRVEARNMLRRLEEILHPTDAVHREVIQVETRTEDGFAVPPSSSLGGVSREAARQFVSEVQPLLMNSCATARCHGTQARNDFRLSPVRIGAGGSRLLTERNLAAVLNRIDADDPRGSSLLVVPRGNHGPGGRAIFSGPRGADQFDLLRGWVLQVAEESLTTGGHPVRTGEHAARSSQEPQPALYPQLSAPGTSGKPSAADDPSETTRVNATLDRDPLLEAILREERPDAFDPAEFNRQTQPSPSGLE